MASAPASDRHQRLRDQHQLAAVEDVGRDAAHQREEDDRQHPHEADHAERQRAAIVGHEQRDVPENRGRLHQAAGKRNQQADPEQTEVPVAERGKQSRFQITSR